MSTTVLALDVGGTKLAAGLVTATAEVVGRAETPTPETRDAEELWSAVTTLVDGVLRERGDLPFAGVGIACGGPMTWPRGEVSPLNIPAWRGFPLLERMRARYGIGLPVAIHNDAVCVAVAEQRWGAGAGRDNVLGMVVSTGVGGGLILGGRRIDGASGNAGHLGHIVVDPAGPPCGCGGRGCLEAIARGPAIAAYAVEQGWAGEQTGIAVAAGARAGDPACRAAFDRAGTAVGIALASAVALLDVDVVAVGGGVAEAGELFFDPVHKAFTEHAGMDFVRRCSIVPAGFGRGASLAGAAALVLDGRGSVSRFWDVDWSDPT
jgi:glucokinase